MQESIGSSAAGNSPSPANHHLVLAIVAHSPLGFADVHAVWQRLGGSAAPAGETDFAVAIAELAAASLIRLEGGGTLVITDAGRQTLGL